MKLGNASLPLTVERGGKTLDLSLVLRERL